MQLIILEELTDAWIISFKVEWRNKTVNYIASQFDLAYREALDAVEKWEKYDSIKLSCRIILNSKQRLYSRIS